MEEEEEFDEVDGDHPDTEPEQQHHREKESRAEGRRTRLRCCQREREASGVQPGDMGAAALTVCDGFVSPASVSVCCLSPWSSNGTVLDVELTATVRVEGGSSLVLLPFATPGSRLSAKPGLFCDQSPFTLSQPLSAWTKGLDGGLLNLHSWPWGFDTDPTVTIASPPTRVNVAKSPLPSPPCTSPSSPSSAPSSPSSSPSSSTSSPGGTVVGYHDNDRGRTEGGAVTGAAGETVSSTSVSPAPLSHPLPPSSSPSVHLSSSPCPVPGRASIEMYDPFHPTEGEADREGRAAVEDDEEEEEGDDEDGDKYDPFDPTGSPASERGRERGIEVEEENGLARKAMLVTEMRVEETGMEKVRERSPADSTDPPVSRPREEREQPRGRESRREWGKGVRERKEVDTDNSEIEEGEIVGVGDRDRKRDRAGERVRAPESAFLHTSRKPERILRVLEGDDFVSVRAEGDWALGRDRDGVGDLRRKLVSRRKERFRSAPSSSLSPPLPLPLPPSVPPAKEKERSRKATRASKEHERHKQKQEKLGEKSDRRRGKDGRSKEKERDNKDGRRGQEEKKREDGRGRSSRSSSGKRKKRLSSPKRSSHSQSSAHQQKHRRHSSSSQSEDRRKDRDRDRRDEREWEKERDASRRSKRKRERGERAGESCSRERGGGSQKKTKSSRERERDRDRDHDRERRRRDGRPVVPPSIQDLNGSDLFAIKRTITVTTTTTTTTVPGSPPLPQAVPDTPPQASDKPRKKKRKRKRREEKEDEEEEEVPVSRSRDSSLTPLRYHDFDSDQFSDKLGVEVLSLDGEALDSDYPSLEDTPPHLPPPSPHPSPKLKAKSKTGRHLKKKSRTGKKASLSETSHRAKSDKGLSSLSPPPVSLVNVPAKHLQKAGKDREKGTKKEGSRSAKSKKLSRGTRKGKLQSKVSVLVRDGVSSTTGGGGTGKRGLLVGSSKTLSASGGSSSTGVVGGSIAVVFRRDNESRSPFLKPCSEPVSVSKGRKCGAHSALAPPSSSSSSSSLSSHLSVVKSKKVEPSSTTSASSSTASSPSSSSTTKQKRKRGKRDREHREKGGAVAEGGGADDRCGLGGGTWGVPLLDTQSSLAASGKPSSPPPPRPQAMPPCSSSSSASASIAPPSTSPPCSPPVPLTVSRETRESTPDSQTVDSSCKTPEVPFVSDDGTGQIQVSPLVPLSNTPPSPPSLQVPLSGTSGVVQSAMDLKLPPEEQKAPTSPPCSSSSSTNSAAASLSLSLPTSSADHSSSASSSVSSSSTSKLPPPPPPGAPPLPWSLQTGVDCTAGGVLALTALLFKMEEANLASRAKAQEFIQATSQILSQANQSQTIPPPSSSSSSSSSQVAPLPSLAPSSVPAPTQFILHSSLPLVSCTKTPPPHLHPGLSLGAGCAQTPPMHGGSLGTTGVPSDTSWDGESKDPDKYLKKLHTQERAVEEVKLAIKPYYQRKDINKDEYKDILRKAVHKICHSRTGEINPVKVSNLVKLYVQRYKYFRKHGRKVGEEDRDGDKEPPTLHSSS